MLPPYFSGDWAPPLYHMSHAAKRYLTAAAAAAMPGLKTPAHHIPVHHTEPFIHISRPQIIVLQIIGMLPYIQIQERVLAAFEGSILIRGNGNPQPPA